jgi:hypothetical protein
MQLLKLILNNEAYFALWLLLLIWAGTTLFL